MRGVLRLAPERRVGAPRSLFAATAFALLALALWCSSAAAAPVNQEPPWWAGQAMTGSELTAGPGSWDDGGLGATFAYRWQRCDSAGAGCADIAGATGESYVLADGDAGATVRVAVTATDASGSSSAYSTATGVIVASTAPVSQGSADIWGNFVETDTVAGGADWGADALWPLTESYQWRRCDTSGGNCADIAGATDWTHTVTAADVGSRLRLLVTATNAKGTDTTVSEPSAVVVENEAPVSVDPPSVWSGTRAGESAGISSYGNWGASTGQLGYAVQWQRCNVAGTTCQDIAGATDSSREITAGDVGSRLRARVTASNGRGTAQAYSGLTDPIEP